MADHGGLGRAGDSSGAAAAFAELLADRVRVLAQPDSRRLGFVQVQVRGRADRWPVMGGVGDVCPSGGWSKLGGADYVR